MTNRTQYHKRRKSPLSAQQHLILAALGHGYRAVDIGRAMGLAGNTVGSHKERICEALDIYGHSAMVRYVHANNIAEPEFMINFSKGIPSAVNDGHLKEKHMLKIEGEEQQDPVEPSTPAPEPAAA